MSGVALRTGMALTVTVELLVPDHVMSADDAETVLPRALRWLADEASAGATTVPVQVTMRARTGDEPATGADLAVHAIEAAPPRADEVLRSTRSATAATAWAHARLAALRHRARSPADTALQIIPASRTVRLGETALALTRLEFDLLHHLATHRGQVFTREQLLRSVWGDQFAGPRTVDVHIRRLRAKAGCGGPLIATVRGVGYRLADGARVTVVPAG